MEEQGTSSNELLVPAYEDNLGLPFAADDPPLEEVGFYYKVIIIPNGIWKPCKNTYGY